MPVNKDTLWQGIIEDLVVEFLHFFFPNDVHLIDIKKGFKFLDKELKQLSPQAESGNRHADKLFQCKLKSGFKNLFLIHVEVQGYPDPNFAKRMFQYAYRIHDRFQLPLTAFVIYTDTNTRYHFKEYREALFGTELCYKFNTYSLIEQEPGQFEHSNNIFGLVMEMARQELIFKRKKDEDRLALKIKLVRHLIKHGISKKKIRSILDFIKFYISFEQSDFFNKFDKSIYSITKSRKAMGIREAILNELKEKAIAEGLEIGIGKGIEQGIEQGIERGIKQGIERGIEKGKAVAIEEKDRIIVSRGIKKGLPMEDIAFLADISIERVQFIIQELVASNQEEE